jgi:hypothetical protein
MLKVYINYADANFRRHQRYALYCAKYFGKFDKVIGLSEENIDRKFKYKYSDILSQKRGAGYWLWKPYFINKMLKQIEYGDYLFYSDSGAMIIKNIDLLISELCKYKQDIMGFELPLIEEQWTKKELFLSLNCDEEKYHKSNQILATYILIRKSKISEQFISDYLRYSCDIINISDVFISSIKQQNNFLEHRHDQSIYSLLYKKYNLRPFKDPSQYGNNPFGYAGVRSTEVALLEDELYMLPNGRLFRYFGYTENYGVILISTRILDPLKSIFIHVLLEAYSKAFSTKSKI